MRQIHVVSEKIRSVEGRPSHVVLKDDGERSGPGLCDKTDGLFYDKSDHLCDKSSKLTTKVVEKL